MLFQPEIFCLNSQNSFFACFLYSFLLVPELVTLCPLSPHILYPLSSESLFSVALSPAVHGCLFTSSLLCKVLLLKKKPNPSFMSFWKVCFFIYVSFLCLGTDLTVLLFLVTFSALGPLLFSVCLFALSWVNFFSHCTSPYVSTSSLPWSSVLTLLAVPEHLFSLGGCINHKNQVLNQG